MKLYELFKRMSYLAGHYVQKVQYFILSLFVIGMVDYLFLYDMFLSLAAFAPVAAVEALPLIILVAIALLVWQGIKHARKKMSGTKHSLFM